MDIEGVIKKIQRDLDSLDKLITNTDTKAISLRFVESLERLNEILEPKRWDNILNSIEKILAIIAKSQSIQKIKKVSTIDINPTAIYLFFIKQHI